MCTNPSPKLCIRAEEEEEGTFSGNFHENERAGTKPYETFVTKGLTRSGACLLEPVLERLEQAITGSTCAVHGRALACTRRRCRCREG